MFIKFKIIIVLEVISIFGSKSIIIWKYIYKDIYCIFFVEVKDWKSEWFLVEKEIWYIYILGC